MRKKIWLLAGGVGVLAAASYASGFTATYIGNAPAMLAGMGAMVSCSQHYVSGIEPEQTQMDLETYSPLFGAVDVSYDSEKQRVTTTVFDIETTSAQYREGLGCALEVGDTSHFEGVEFKAPMNAEAEWPLGDKVESVNPGVQETLDAILKADNEAGLQTRALLVAKGGKVIAETYADGFDASSKLLGWSMSKSFNAVMVGNMEMRGLIDPNKKPVFAEWSEDARASISLDDMLHMTSGLDLSEVYDPGTAVTSMLFTDHSAASTGLQVGLVAEPGTHYDYSSGTSNLLSKLVFDAAGGTLRHSIGNLETHFIQPMGLNNFVFETDPSGVFLGSSFVLASARDWAKLGQLMLNGGELNGHRIVTEDWVKRAVTPNKSENRKGYGYQFWLNRGDAAPRWADLPEDAYAALGSRDQVVMVVPSADLVMVRLGWNLDGEYPKNDNFRKMLDKSNS